MPMQPFFSIFADLAARETRIAIAQGSDALPVGEYGFVELYCNEMDCDCRRVLIQVMRPDTGDKVWATISYGWDEDGDDHPGAYLDPINPQTEYANELLDIFIYNIDNDKAYVDRLKGHYAMFKEAIAREHPTMPDGSSMNRAERREMMREMRRRKGKWQD